MQRERPNLQIVGGTDSELAHIPEKSPEIQKFEPEIEKKFLIRKEDIQKFIRSSGYGCTYKIEQTWLFNEKLDKKIKIREKELNRIIDLISDTESKIEGLPIKTSTQRNGQRLLKQAKLKFTLDSLLEKKTFLINELEKLRNIFSKNGKTEGESYFRFGNRIRKKTFINENLKETGHIEYYKATKRKKKKVETIKNEDGTETQKKTTYTEEDEKKVPDEHVSDLEDLFVDFKENKIVKKRHTIRKEFGGRIYEIELDEFEGSDLCVAEIEFKDGDTNKRIEDAEKFDHTGFFALFGMEVVDVTEDRNFKNRFMGTTKKGRSFLKKGFRQAYDVFLNQRKVE